MVARRSISPAHKTHSFLRERLTLESFIFLPWKTKSPREFHEEKSNVVHLFLFSAFIKQLLEGYVVSSGFHRLLESPPGSPKFRGAIRIGEGRCIEKFAMDSAQHITKTDLRRRTRQ